MTNNERLLSVLQDANEPLCDACLMGLAQLSSRQVTYMLTTALGNHGVTERVRGVCGGCGKGVLCSRLKRRPGFVVPRSQLRPRGGFRARPGVSPESPVEPALANPMRPWYWAGNLEDRVEAWLVAQAWAVLPKPTSHSAGVGLTAQRADGQVLRVVVADVSPGDGALQARNAFAEVVLKLVLCRQRSEEAYLAAVFPDNSTTLHSLAEETAWLRKTLPCSYLWVSPTGEVRSV